jgi:hypothetical protein
VRQSILGERDETSGQGMTGQKEGIRSTRSADCARRAVFNTAAQACQEALPRLKDIAEFQAGSMSTTCGAYDTLSLMPTPTPL